jgi:hypothetical protein
MSDRTQKGGQDEDQIFWKRIADQVGVLLDAPVSDRK